MNHQNFERTLRFRQYREHACLSVSEPHSAFCLCWQSSWTRWGRARRFVGAQAPLLLWRTQFDTGLLESRARFRSSLTSTFGAGAAKHSLCGGPSAAGVWRRQPGARKGASPFCLALEPFRSTSAPSPPIYFGVRGCGVLRASTLAFHCWPRCHGTYFSGKRARTLRGFLTPFLKRKRFSV